MISKFVRIIFAAATILSCNNGFAEISCDGSHFSTMQLLVDEASCGALSRADAKKLNCAQSDAQIIKTKWRPDFFYLLDSKKTQINKATGYIVNELFKKGVARAAVCYPAIGSSGSIMSADEIVRNGTSALDLLVLSDKSDITADSTDVDTLNSRPFDEIDDKPLSRKLVSRKLVGNIRIPGAADCDYRWTVTEQSTYANKGVTKIVNNDFICESVRSRYFLVK